MLYYIILNNRLLNERKFVMLSVLRWINENILGLFLPALLFVSGAYFLLRIGRYTLRPLFAVKALSEKPDVSGNGKTPLSSLCLALAGTLGVGNITGVAGAIMIGGPGCVFWIWICAIVSAVLKFAETALAVHYRETDRSGNPAGGAHSYIKNGLGCPALASFFCILCIFSSFTVGNMTQVRAAADGLSFACGVPDIITACVFLTAVLYLTVSNKDRISGFTAKIIPILCTGYVIAALCVIFILRDKLGEITSLIIADAFTPRAGMSGFIGFLCSPALRLGIQRGIMSNEAGCGTAPIAHAGAVTDHPARQGFLGIAEVLCDTLLLCTLTAYVILLSGAVPSGSSTELALNSFTSVLGNGIRYFLGAAIFLFALASVAGWAYYGRESLRALGLGNRYYKIYGLIFACAAFAGCLIPEGPIWQLSDISISLMAIINVGALLMLAPTVTYLSKDFYLRRKQKNPEKSGKISSNTVKRTFFKS